MLSYRDAYLSGCLSIGMLIYGEWEHAVFRIEQPYHTCWRPLQTTLHLQATLSHFRPLRCAIDKCITLLSSPSFLHYYYWAPLVFSRSQKYRPYHTFGSSRVRGVLKSDNGVVGGSPNVGYIHQFWSADAESVIGMLATEVWTPESVSKCERVAQFWRQHISIPHR